jgi:hypothetical protein
MRVLLTDGSGLTAKQTAYRLGSDGHHVGALAPGGLSLTRFTRHVARVHPVAPYGPDPLAWLDAALSVWADGSFDVLIPTQEQVAVLSSAPGRLAAAGVATCVPPFDALAAVQDKVSAHRTLARLGLPQPEGTVVDTRAALAGHRGLPVFVKEPIGTATTGVHLVRTPSELAALAAGFQRKGVFEAGGALVQSPVQGPLAMVQSVFDHGRLVAFHACERTAEGINGGASHKRSVDLPAARKDIERLGSELGWHGALSVDVIVADRGPLIIDVNPRLVEPANAFASGVDLVGAMLAVAQHSPRPGPETGRSGIQTHQLLLALLGAAARSGRRAVLAELIAAVGHRGLYRDSAEELSPARHDRRAVVPVAAAAVATLVRPSVSSWFTEGSVANYSLTPEGWQLILDAALTPSTGPDRPATGWRR